MLNENENWSKGSAKTGIYALFLTGVYFIGYNAVLADDGV